MAFPPKVAVIILNWNGRSDTHECLESLKAVTYLNFEIVLVDNGSRPEDVEWLEARYAESLHLVKSPSNLGFAGGNNLGVRYAREKLEPNFFLLLNNDTVASPRFLTELVDAALEETHVGIAGPKILIHGTNILDSAGSAFDNIGHCWSRGNLEPDTGQYDTREEMPMITACCCLIPAHVLGGDDPFDPYLFLYYEELDLNIRIKAMGYKTLYVPSSRIWHKYSATVKSLPHPQVLKRYYMATNQLYVLLKHFPLGALMRSSHLVAASLLYQEYLILRLGGLRWLGKLNVRLLASLSRGLSERIRIGVKRPRPWINAIVRHNLRDLIRQRRHLEIRLNRLSKIEADTK